MKINNYNNQDPIDIYRYSKGLEGLTFRDVELRASVIIKESDNTNIYYENKKRKGGLGQLIEEKYFGYECNNDMGPDFPEAGLELKVTPYKKNKNGTYSSKERMILNMIDYFEIIDEDFYESRVWHKNQLILIVFYLWEKEIKNRLDYKIKYTYLYTPPEEDLKIIIDDYNFIKNKVKEGRAHELSEGDTVYLGAATKAATSKDLRMQPASDIPAKPRAFSLKNSYMTYILRNYVIPKKDIYKPLIEYKKLETKKDDKIIKNTDELANITFEEYILNKINKYKNKSLNSLYKKFYNLKTDEEVTRKTKKNNKGKYSNLAFRMLDIKSNQAEEFVKAGITVKSIKVEKTGRIKESMSFPAFTITDEIYLEWEDTLVYNIFESSKFLLMIFAVSEDGNEYFREAKFWNMPMNILETDVKKDWNKIRKTFLDGVTLNPKKNKSGKFIVYNNLPKKKDLNILQVRPHASKSYHVINGIKYGSGKKSDSDLLPNGDRITKQCFWLQNTFVEKVVQGENISSSYQDFEL